MINLHLTPELCSVDDILYDVMNIPVTEHQEYGHLIAFIPLHLHALRQQYRSTFNLSVIKKLRCKKFIILLHTFQKQIGQVFKVQIPTRNDWGNGYPMKDCDVRF